MQIDLQLILGRKVDLVSARGLSKYIGPIIEAEKKLIYARKAG
jgi:predicted nucleotidyltransferase